MQPGGSEVTVTHYVVAFKDRPCLGSTPAELIGKTLVVGSGTSATPLTVIGVVGNFSLGNYRQSDHELFFRSGVQAGQATMSTVHLRTSAKNPLSVSKEVTDVINSFHVEHVSGPYPLERLFANSLVAERLAVTVGLSEALLAVLVSCIGLYALISQAIINRRKELGIRLALGAQPFQLWSGIAASGLGWVIAGTLGGYPLALAATSLIKDLLFNVGAGDTAPFVTATLGLVLCGAFASGLSAWRAIEIEPVNALREP